MGMFDAYFRPVPQSPTARGMASVGDALDRVMRAKEARDLAAQQAEAQMAERRLQERAAWEREVFQQRQMGERQQAQLGAQQEAARVKAAQRVLPDVYGAIDALDHPRARGLAAANGIDMNQSMRPQEETPHAELDPAAAAQRVATFGFAPDVDAEQRVAGMPWADRARVERQNARNRELDALDPLWSLRVPGQQGEVLRSAGQAQDARRGRGRELAQQLESMRPALGSPYGRQALAEQVSRAQAGGYDEKDDLAADAIANARQLESLQIRRQNANRPRGDKDDRKHAQVVDDERSDVTAFGANYDRWEMNTDVRKLTEEYKKFSRMTGAMESYRQSGDVISQRDALYNAARLISGPGILTDAEFQNTVQRTGGLIASALSKINKNLDGSISDQEAEALEKYVRNASGLVKGAAVRAVRNFDDRFGGSYFERTVPGEVAATRRALISRFGLSEEDVTPKKAPKARSAPQLSDDEAAFLEDAEADLR